MPPQALTAGLLITTFLVSGAGASQATFRLEPGTPLDDELRGEEIHVYEVELAVGRSWRLEVTASGNEALVSVTGDRSADSAQARQLLTVRTLFGLGWSEALTWTSRITGTTRITIRGAALGAAVGPYRLVLEPVAERTPQDRQALLAERLLTVIGGYRDLVLHGLRRRSARRRGVYSSVGNGEPDEHYDPEGKHRRHAIEPEASPAGTCRPPLVLLA